MQAECGCLGGVLKSEDLHRAGVFLIVPNLAIAPPGLSQARALGTMADRMSAFGQKRPGRYLKLISITEAVLASHPMPVHQSHPHHPMDRAAA